MAKRVGFIHTFSPTVELVDRLAARHLDDAELHHVMDDDMRRDNALVPPGETPPQNIEKYIRYAKKLEQAGCEAIFSCCSLMRSGVRESQKQVSVPVYQLDDPVFAMGAGVGAGQTVGLCFANANTVPHALRALESFAGVGMPKTIVHIDREAYAAMGRGDDALHDARMLESVAQLAAQADAVLLGHINLASLEERIDALALPVPVYGAGSLAFRHIRCLLDKQGWVSPKTSEGDDGCPKSSKTDRR